MLSLSYLNDFKMNSGETTVFTCSVLSGIVNRTLYQKLDGLVKYWTPDNPMFFQVGFVTLYKLIRSFMCDFWS